MADERRTVQFTGRVQGVGFRWTACRAAAGYALAGYVRGRSAVLYCGAERLL